MGSILEELRADISNRLQGVDFVIKSTSQFPFLEFFVVPGTCYVLTAW